MRSYYKNKSYMTLCLPIANQILNDNYICLYFGHLNEYTVIRTINAKPNKVVTIIDADFDIIKAITYAVLDIRKIMPTITFIHRLAASFKHKVKMAINNENITQKTLLPIDIID